MSRRRASGALMILLVVGQGCGGGSKRDGQLQLPELPDIHQTGQGLSVWVVTDKRPTALTSALQNPTQFFVFDPTVAGAVSSASFTGFEFLNGALSPLTGSFSGQQIQFVVRRAGSNGSSVDVLFKGTIQDLNTMVLTSSEGETLTLKRVSCQEVTPNVCATVFDIHQSDGITSAWGTTGADRLFVFDPDVPGEVSGASFTGSEFLAGVPSALDGSFSGEQIEFAVGDEHLKGTIANPDTLALLSGGDPPLFLKRQPCPSTICPVSLSITPASQAVVRGGEPVTFMAVLSGSSAPISWSLSGPGGISPMAGSTTVYTPPPSFDPERATATLTATAGRSTATASIVVTPPPTLGSVDPGSGPMAGDTRVTITGTGFMSGAAVSFGGSSGTGVSVGSPTSLAVTTPAHAPGTVEVIVTNPDAQASAPLRFTFVEPPIPRTVSPASASISVLDGGTADGGAACPPTIAVTLAGTGFVAGAAVSFGGTMGTNVMVSSPISLTVTTPDLSSLGLGAKDVTVTNPDGQSSTLPGAFTVDASGCSPGGE